MLEGKVLLDLSCKVSLGQRMTWMMPSMFWMSAPLRLPHVVILCFLLAHCGTIPIFRHLNHEWRRVTRLPFVSDALMQNWFSKICQWQLPLCVYSTTSSRMAILKKRNSLLRRLASYSWMFSRLFIDIHWHISDREEGESYTKHSESIGIE